MKDPQCQQRHDKCNRVLEGPTRNSYVAASSSACVAEKTSLPDKQNCVSRARLCNRRSSEIQGTALGKCLQARPVYIYIYISQSMPAGVAQSRHAFVGGTVSTWGR